MASPFPRFVLVLLALGAGALLAWSALGERRLLEEKRQLAETAQQLGVLDVQVLDDLVSADDPDRARTRLARALVGAEAVGLVEMLPTEIRAKRLRAAATLARTSLKQRPSSWEAAMLAGAAQYLEWSVLRDDRLLTEYQSWEKPLELAHSLAPDKQEPARFLASAYLELWPALSERKRQTTRELLTIAFEDPATFARLIEPWLIVSRSTGEDPLQLIPDRADAWSRLEAVYRSMGDLPALCRARDGRRRALPHDLERLLEEGDNYVLRGNLLMARSRFLFAVALAPLDVAYAPYIDRAMASTPTGPTDPARVENVGAWLDWCLDLASAGPGCPLAPDTLEGLLNHLPIPGPEQSIERARAARTALVLGDLPSAERIERQTEAPWTSGWEIYRVEKARMLLDRGDLEAARRELADVTGPWADRYPTWQARQSLAQATGDMAAEARAEAAMERLATTAWSPEIWSGHTRFSPNDSQRAEFVTSSAVQGVEIDLAGPAGLVSAIDVRLDGKTLGCFTVPANDRLTVKTSASAGSHGLEIQSVAGPAIKPGSVTALP